MFRKETAALCHPVYLAPVPPTPPFLYIRSLLVTQALARGRQRRSLEEGGGDDEQRRSLQDAEGADGVHAGIHAAAGYHGADGEQWVGVELKGLSPRVVELMFFVVPFRLFPVCSCSNRKLARRADVIISCWRRHPDLNIGAMLPSVSTKCLESCIHLLACLAES